MQLDTGVRHGGEVVVQRREQPHDVRRAAGDRVPAVASLTVSRLQRVGVEERLAVERDPGEEAVVQRSLEEVGEAALARDEQHPPVPHDAGDRRARFAVGAVGRQLVPIADRLTMVARADATGQIGLRRGQVVPLEEHRGEQRLVARLGVDVGDPGCEIERAHGVSDDRPRVANRLSVLVVVEVETAVREHAVSPPRGQRVGQLQVALPARLAVQLDKRELDLGMSVGACLGACAEDLVDQVGEATCDREEGRVARRSCGRHSSLEEMACAVELVAHLQVGPAPARVDDLAPAVEIAVRLLCRGDKLGRFARVALERGRRLAAELPGDRLEPLVDIRVAEHHAPTLTRDASRGDAQVVERPGALELLGTSKKRDLPVHPLAVRQQAVADDDAAAVDRAESHASGGGRRDARDDACRRLEHLVLVLHGISQEGRM